jgi:hypothetical protein
MFPSVGSTRGQKIIEPHMLDSVKHECITKYSLNIRKKQIDIHHKFNLLVNHHLCAKVSIVIVSIRRHPVRSSSLLIIFEKWPRFLSSRCP